MSETKTSQPEEISKKMQGLAEGVLKCLCVEEGVKVNTSELQKALNAVVAEFGSDEFREFSHYYGKASMGVPRGSPGVDEKGNVYANTYVDMLTAAGQLRVDKTMLEVTGKVDKDTLFRAAMLRDHLKIICEFHIPAINEAYRKKAYGTL